MTIEPFHGHMTIEPFHGHATIDKFRGHMLFDEYLPPDFGSSPVNSLRGYRKYFNIYEDAMKDKDIIDLNHINGINKLISTSIDYTITRDAVVSLLNTTLTILTRQKKEEKTDSITASEIFKTLRKNTENIKILEYINEVNRNLEESKTVDEKYIFDQIINTFNSAYIRVQTEMIIPSGWSSKTYINGHLIGGYYKKMTMMINIHLL